MFAVVAFAVVAFIAIYLISTYNRLVALRNRFKNAFAQIDIQLERRYDLIPNLIETARAYMAHERETLEAVVRARNAAVAAGKRAAANPADTAAVQGLASAEQALTGVLTRFFALSEAYPELKSNENMKQLTEELTSTENRIAFARQSYNDAVTVYNTARESFPANLVAGPFGFEPGTLLILEDASKREAPKVSFSR